MAQKNLRRKFRTNLLIKRGLKESIEKLFEKICSKIKNNLKKNPITQINQSLNILKPFYQMKLMKVRNNLVKVPIELVERQQQTFVVRFIISTHSQNSHHFLSKKVAIDLLSSLDLSGNALKVCQMFQKNVETNKVFVDYRF